MKVTRHLIWGGIAVFLGATFLQAGYWFAGLAELVCGGIFLGVYYVEELSRCF